MTYRKKLIEVALPLEAINEASAREKSIRHGHPSTLHLWWARRPLAACRAVIFASLVDDPNDPEAPAEFVEACRNLPRGKNAAADDTPRQRLFDFIETLVQWESTTDEQVLATARRLIRLATNDNPPPLLDPFAGGGSIPLEAQRLGLEAHASDLNPVAVMINKALIEIPPRFANMPPVNPRDREKMGSGTRWKGAAGLAADVRYYGQWMRARAWERIGHLYPDHNGETVIAWLWAHTVRCPNPACGAQMPLISSFWLSKRRGHQAWLKPDIDRRARTISFSVRTGEGVPSAPPKVSRGANFRCLICDEIAPDQHLKDEGMAKRMGSQLVAIITEGADGRHYYAPTQEHTRIATQAEPVWQVQGELADDKRAIWCRRYGLAEFSDLFTPRQLVAMTTLSNLIADVRKEIYKDAIAAGTNDGSYLPDCGLGALSYAEAVIVYLAFAVDKVAESNTQLCTWSPLSSKLHVVSTFGRQALPMVWDYAESNPFADSSGNVTRMADLVAKVLEKQTSSHGIQGVAVQADVRTEAYASTRSLVSTDPPYYDNIGYADLSDFFYVWLRHNLKDSFPSLFGTLLVPKEQELVAAAHRFGSIDEAQAFFETGLRQAFEQAHNTGHPDYPLTIFYAFRQTEIVAEQEKNGQAVSSTGWETMLEGLIQARFAINGTWPMRTERSGGFRNLDQNALASSIVLVCRPRPDAASMISRREFVNALRRELPDALQEIQSGNIAPVDLAQASIGPGMAVYSRYSKVLEPNGDRLTVRTALQLINHELDAYLAEQEGHIDEDSRFAVAWFEQFGFREGPFGQADVLARAKNTSVDGLAHAGVLESGAGKVRLRRWSELDPAWDPRTDRRLTVWETVHHLVERLNVYGEEGAAMLLAKMPSELAAQARQLAYRLYSICERKGWAEHARDYNALVISWGASQEQARGFREEYQQGGLL